MKQDEQPTTFRTVPVERGDLQATISSTATIEPEEVVDIGAQVAGMIKFFGKDPRDKTKDIDYGTPVDEGTVLAQIDDAIYKTQVDGAKATLDSNIALLAQAKTKLALSNQNWERAQNLRKSNVMTQADYDAAYADLQTSTPAVDAAKAAVDQAKAILQQRQTNLRYSTIVSPVKGVIIDRRVNIGQTVVASLSAPSLFLIAKDLKRLQLWASVNEADIGQIHADQSARFTVDAFPRKSLSRNRLADPSQCGDDPERGDLHGRRHDGQFKRTAPALPDCERASSRWPITRMCSRCRQPPCVGVRSRSRSWLQPATRLPRRHIAAKAAVTVRGAVPVVVAAEMGVVVAVAAAVEEGRDPKRSPAVKVIRLKENKTAKEAARRPIPARLPTVWVDDNGFARPIQVQTGLTDGTEVEIVSGEVKEGTRVIIGEQRHDEGTAATKNPFLPSFFRGRSPKEIRMKLVQGPSSWSAVGLWTSGLRPWT